MAKKPNCGPDFDLFGPIWVPQKVLVGLLVDVRHCGKLSAYAISTKTYQNKRK